MWGEEKCKYFGRNLGRTFCGHLKFRGLLERSTGSRLAGWHFANIHLFSQTNTLPHSCLWIFWMPSICPAILFGLATPCLWQNLNTTPWTSYSGQCFDWLSAGYSLMVKIGLAPYTGWTGKLILRCFFGNAHHVHGKYSRNWCVSQQNFRSTKFLGCSHKQMASNQGVTAIFFQWTQTWARSSIKTMGWQCKKLITKSCAPRKKYLSGVRNVNPPRLDVAIA